MQVSRFFGFINSQTFLMIQFSVKYYVVTERSENKRKRVRCYLHFPEWRMVFLIARYKEMSKTLETPVEVLTLQ